jgi:hypothetical protein
VTTIAHAMSTTNTTAPARAAAIGAFGFAAGVALQNFVLLVGMPDAAASTTEAATWLAENRSRAAMASALVGVNLPLLLLFTAALRTLTQDSPGARMWIDLGSFAVAVLAATFGVVAATQVASTLLAEAGATPVFTAVWSLHNAAFPISFAALGTVLVGFSVGAHAAGISPGWHRGVGLLAAGLLLVAGLANAAVAGGAPIVYVGLMGFALWLVWLITTGVRVLR